MVWQASRRLICESARSKYKNVAVDVEAVMETTDFEEKPYELFIGTNYGFKVNLVSILIVSFFIAIASSTTLQSFLI